MPGVNTYKDTEAADYLDAIRKHQAENRNANSGAANFSPTYVLQRSNQINVSNSFTNTAQTLGDYDVTDNTAYLVAYLPFQLDSLDASNTNHGTWTGSETYTTGPEISATKYQKAADFDNSSYVTLANESNFDFDITDAFSVSCWCKFDDIGTTSMLVVKDDIPTTNTGWAIYRLNSNDKIVFSCKPSTSANASIQSTTVTVANTWYHVVVTKSTTANRSGMKIYVNGTLETTGSDLAMTGILTNAQPVVIGAESDGGNTHSGMIAEVQVWNSELDSDDVTDLYHGKQINKDTAATNPAIIGYSDVT